MSIYFKTPAKSARECLDRVSLLFGMAGNTSSTEVAVALTREGVDMATDAYAMAYRAAKAAGDHISTSCPEPVTAADARRTLANMVAYGDKDVSDAVKKRNVAALPARLKEVCDAVTYLTTPQGMSVDSGLEYMVHLRLWALNAAELAERVHNGAQPAPAATSTVKPKINL